ncbi:MAG: hypothetical protein F6J93_05020 [Oscillatoria sp. SIO1A7]|nr:hypothetical protein [Oscillatoria sp. SIO1A7]
MPNAETQDSNGYGNKGKLTGFQITIALVPCCSGANIAPVELAFYKPKVVSSFPGVDRHWSIFTVD